METPGSERFKGRCQQDGKAGTRVSDPPVKEGSADQLVLENSRAERYPENYLLLPPPLTEERGRAGKETLPVLAKTKLQPSFSYSDSEVKTSLKT